MQNDKGQGENSPEIQKQVGSYGVILPCEPADFGEFVSGLLGKPQTIEKVFNGVYEVEKNDISNVFHLVNQRIHQQNDATLVQFTVKILYNDDSSVLLNSLEDFEHYSEIKPLISVGVSLSWSYLIKFKNKQVPEKQELSLSFRSNDVGHPDFVIEDGLIIKRGKWYGPSGIFLRIQHTERTWGVDMESLINGHVKTLMKTPRSTELFLVKNSGTVGFAAGSLLFIGSILGVFITISKFIESYTSKLSEMVTNNTANIEIMSTKLNFLLEVIATGVWPRFIFSVIGFLIISLFISIFMGTWVASAADNRPNSYVLLSSEANKRKATLESRRKRDWTMFLLSILASIVAGVVSNIIFTHYFGAV